MSYEQELKQNKEGNNLILNIIPYFGIFIIIYSFFISLYLSSDLYKEIPSIGIMIIFFIFCLGLTLLLAKKLNNKMEK